MAAALPMPNPDRDTVSDSNKCETCGKTFHTVRALLTHRHWHTLSKARRSEIAAKRQVTLKRTIKARRRAEAKAVLTPAPAPGPTTTALVPVAPTVVVPPRGRPKLEPQSMPTLLDAIEYLQNKVDVTQTIIDEFRGFAAKFNKR